MATAFAKKVASSTVASRPAVAPRASGRAFTAPKAVMASAVSGFSGAPAARKAVSARASGVSRRAAVAVKAAHVNIGDSLSEFLAVATPDPKLRQLMTSMSEAIRTIAHKVRTASCGGTACVNSFGDEQLAVDMVADGLLFEALKYSHVCSWACSEEVPEPVNMGGSGYSVAFDPLDGSSIVDTNFAVGTIFGVWPGDKLTGITGRDQAAAGMGVYGPRTVFVVAMKDFPGTYEFLLQDDGKWLLVKETTEIGEGKLFAPGNLRAIFDNPEYNKLVSYYLEEQYTLRYTGGMVPDVFQILVKEKGVFTNVTSPTTKAKLRLLFEVAPLALLVENAGGASSCDGLGISGLDVEVKAHDQRTQICYGSKGEVARFEKYMLGESKRFAELAEAK